MRLKKQILHSTLHLAELSSLLITSDLFTGTVEGDRFTICEEKFFFNNFFTSLFSGGESCATIGTLT